MSNLLILALSFQSSTAAAAFGKKENVGLFMEGKWYSNV